MKSNARSMISSKWKPCSQKERTIAASLNPPKTIRIKRRVVVGATNKMTTSTGASIKRKTSTTFTQSIVREMGPIMIKTLESKDNMMTRVVSTELARKRKTRKLVVIIKDDQGHLMIIMSIQMKTRLTVLRLILSGIRMVGASKHLIITINGEIKPKVQKQWRTISSKSRKR